MLLSTVYLLLFFKKKILSGILTNSLLTLLIFSVLSENDLILFFKEERRQECTFEVQAEASTIRCFSSAGYQRSPERNENNRAGVRIEFARSSHQENSITTHSLDLIFFSTCEHTCHNLLDKISSLEKN